MRTGNDDYATTRRWETLLKLPGDQATMKIENVVPTISVAVTRAKMALMDKQLKHRQKGLTTVEYAVAGALVAATVVAAFAALGNAVENVINGLEDAID